MVAVLIHHNKPLRCSPAMPSKPSEIYRHVALSKNHRSRTGEKIRLPKTTMCMLCLPGDVLLVSLQLKYQSERAYPILSYHIETCSPFKRRLSLRKPTSRYITVEHGQCKSITRKTRNRTLSLLRTRLIMIASFSRPCIPSTVPISSSSLYSSDRRAEIWETWAWYLSTIALDWLRIHRNMQTRTYGVMMAIWEG